MGSSAPALDLLCRSRLRCWLRNIWGFPTQTASNGGAAFLVAYLVLAFCLAYPALMAELVIGRHGQANAVSSLRKVTNQPWQKKLLL